MFKPLSNSNTNVYYEVTPEALPLSCPLPSYRLWDAHPKIYLPITKKGHVTCPYCGAQYILRT